MPGWIKLYRKLLDSDMYKSLTSKQRDVLIAVLLMVNFEKKKWEWGGEVFECNPGQCITSLDSILKKCAKEMKVQSVRTALLKLERWGFLTNVSTNTGRLITILNWSEYQSDNYDVNKATNKELTKRQQSSNKELTPSKKYKEVKEGKEEEIKEGEKNDRPGNDNLVPLSYLNGDGYSQHMQNQSKEDGKGHNPFPVVNGGDGDNGVKPACETNINGGLLNGQDTANTRTGLDVPGPSLNDDIHTGDNRGGGGDNSTIGSISGKTPMGDGGTKLDREEVGHDDSRKNIDSVNGAGGDRGDNLFDNGGIGRDILGAKKEDEAKPKPAKKKPKKKNGVVLDYSVLDPAIDEDVIKKFVEFRRVDKKKPVKTQATLEGIATAALTCRDVFGHDPNHCLLYTMQAGANGGWLLPKPEYFENEGISFKMWEKRLTANLPKNQNKIKCKECANFGTCQNAEEDPIASCALYTQREMVAA